jgi:hypothetical protein
MPGLLKIGFTNRPIEQRIIELDNSSSIPTPFELEFCVRVKDAQGLERRLHSALHEFRVSNQKEFFRLLNEEAIKRILAILTSDEFASLDKVESSQISQLNNDSLTNARRQRAKRVFDNDDTVEVTSRRTIHNRRPNADNGAHLNELWKIGAEQTRFRETGTFYMPLNRFPGALCDSNGFILFKTEADYRNCSYLRIGSRLSVPRGISKIPGYVRMR